METVIRRDATGYVIDGVKHFCTMALGASYYMIWCALEGGTDMAKALQLALVPAGRARHHDRRQVGHARHARDLQPLGHVHRRRAPEDGLLGDPGGRGDGRRHRELRARLRRVYLGIAESALAFALDYAKKRVVKPENVAVATDPTVQRHVGELAVQLDAAALVLADSAARWDGAIWPSSGRSRNRAKYLATEVGLDVTSKVIQVVGGRGAYKDFPASARSAICAPAR
jgi:alkylation response protein AidB-like acyl-CoA dehydrogenase